MGKSLVEDIIEIHRNFKQSKEITPLLKALMKNLGCEITLKIGIDGDIYFKLLTDEEEDGE